MGQRYRRSAVRLHNQLRGMVYPRQGESSADWFNAEIVETASTKVLWAPIFKLDVRVRDCPICEKTNQRFEINSKENHFGVLIQSRALTLLFGRYHRNIVAVKKVHLVRLFEW